MIFYRVLTAGWLFSGIVNQSKAKSDNPSLFYGVHVTFIGQIGWKISKREKDLSFMLFQNQSMPTFLPSWNESVPQP